MSRVLTIDNLHVSFDTYAGEVKAVRGVSLHVDAGEVLALVGESGCGKSVTAQSVMRLNPEPPARIPYGTIRLVDHDIVGATEKQLQSIRGKDVSVIFQDPMTSLNPTMPVGKQLTEAIRLHQKLSRADAAAKAVQLLELVRIPNAAQRSRQYPHEYSGGMRQRAMIAMALSCEPQLLIADEPTTALDVTIQAQIMELISDIRKQTGTAIILITHDLGVVAGVADRVAVMYAGKIVENGTVDDVFYHTAHPYTLALLESLPTTETDRGSKRLISIPGTPPDLLNPPKGCPFAPRCRFAMRVCQGKMPPFYPVGAGHESACWLQHASCPAEAKEAKMNG